MASRPSGRSTSSSRSGELPACAAAQPANALARSAGRRAERVRLCESPYSGRMSARTIPILPSRHFDETARFYAPLGFAESKRWPNEYLILRRDDGIELHFWSNPKVERATNDVACYVRFDTAAETQALYDAWA